MQQIPVVENTTQNDLINKNMHAVFRKEQFGIKLPKAREPKYHTIIITSMDARVDPGDIFELEPGDVLVLRTAGFQITPDVIRSVLLAMMATTINEIIVLGHTDTLLAMGDILDKNYSRFFQRIPQYNRYHGLLNTKEKARQYFGFFKSEVDNVFTQIENLKFLTSIQPSLQISAMLFNTSNGHVYSMEELKELKKMLDKNPRERIEDIIPVRYDDFVAKEKARVSSARSSLGGAPAVISPRAARGQASNVQGYKDAGDTSSGPVSELELADNSDLGLDVELPPLDLQPMPGSEVLDEIKNELTSTMSIMQKSMQKSMKRFGEVRVFVPKVRMPKVPGSKAAQEQASQEKT